MLRVECIQFLCDGEQRRIRAWEYVGKCERVDNVNRVCSRVVTTCGVLLLRARDAAEQIADAALFLSVPDVDGEVRPI